MLPSNFFLRCTSLVSNYLHVGLLHGWFKYTFVTSSTDCPCVVGPCHHGMARPQVVDRGTASNMEGSCE